MVTYVERLGAWAAQALWAEAGVQKLPPPTRAAVIMALLGIALAGMLIVVIILLGGHWVRRQGIHRRGPAVPPDRLPMRRPAAPAADAATDSLPATTDTISDRPNSSETLT